MSYCDVKPVRCIKIGEKTYRDAHQATIAYSRYAATEHFDRYIKHQITDPNIVDKLIIVETLREKFYRRSHKIFTKYFKGQ